MDTLADYITTLAAQISPEHGLTQEQMIRLVTYYLEQMRVNYRALDSPLGDTDAGFVRWMQQRKQPPA